MDLGDVDMRLNMSGLTTNGPNGIAPNSSGLITLTRIFSLWRFAIQTSRLVREIACVEIMKKKLQQEVASVQDER